MTIAYSAEFDGFKGEAVRIEMTETSKGMRYCGPGSWVEDRLSVSAHTGMVEAERVILGNNNETIIVTIAIKIALSEAEDLIESILSPYREPYETIDIWPTDLEITDSDGKKHSMLGGSIPEVLEELGLDLDHPFPDGTELKVDKYSY